MRIGKKMKTDTIAAIATAMSNSGIGIIRISGCDAIQIANKILDYEEAVDYINTL